MELGAGPGAGGDKGVGASGGVGGGKDMGRAEEVEKRLRRRCAWSPVTLAAGEDVRVRLVGRGVRGTVGSSGRGLRDDEF